MANYNSFGVDQGSKSYAGDTFAALTRQQWADYVRTFVPLENQLIQQATDPNAVKNAMAEAGTNVNNAFDAQQSSTDRRLKGLGVTLSPEEKAAQTKSFGLSRALADVQAQNLTRDLTERRQQSIMGNPAPSAVTGMGTGGA